LALHGSTGTYIQGSDFCNYIGVFMSLPLPGLELQIGKCSPELVKNVIDNIESQFLEFFRPMHYLSAVV
jgi:hypothetical protein